jgi:hypothetical protein
MFHFGIVCAVFSALACERSGFGLGSAFVVRGTRRAFTIEETECLLGA